MTRGDSREDDRDMIFPGTYLAPIGIPGENRGPFPCCSANGHCEDEHEGSKFRHVSTKFCNCCRSPPMRP
jgi:hypothetical protein